jgi:hypothetical protein
VTLLEQSRYRIVCIADLPPSGPSKTRYLVRKLRAALPELTIVVGRWAPPALADDSLQPLVEAGAAHAARTLVETRTTLVGLVEARDAESELVAVEPEPARASGDRAGRA